METGDGQPFLWLADTAWELLNRLRPAEALHYLRVRAGQGFNVVQLVALAEFGGLGPNVLGHVPLLERDPRTPNPAYFEYLDSVLTWAEELGLYVCLLPAWGDKVTPGWGAGPVVLGEANAYVYARWLAERYRDRENLIWMLGGDRPAHYDDHHGQADHRPIWRSMARAILEQIPAALIGYHTGGGPAHWRTARMLPAEPWLHFNSLQSGHGGGFDLPLWDWIGEDLRLDPSRPVLDLEANYEGSPVSPWPEYIPLNGRFTDHDVRKQLWRGVLAGAAGMSYGHHSVWQFWDSGREPVLHPDSAWLEALHHPGAVHAGIMRRLLDAHLPLRTPAQQLIAPVTDHRPSHARAALDPTGQTALIYLPSSQGFTVRLAGFGGDVRARWLDPRSGDAHSAFDIPARPAQLLHTPPGGPDWVLKLEAVPFTPDQG
ncbi:DUF4038 domain-containing protein [Deinococcus sp.]|uniref:apiosidase-like domain-containing protein n=1 Tax=Deinococcus sp. TaxID=47478 RepID=UPI003C7E7896